MSDSGAVLSPWVQPYPLMATFWGHPIRLSSSGASRRGASWTLTVGHRTVGLLIEAHGLHHLGARITCTVNLREVTLSAAW
jgi:hypothetical protein